MGSAVGVGELRSRELGSGDWVEGGWGRGSSWGRGVWGRGGSGGLGSGRLGSGECGRESCCPRVKLSSRQIVFASIRPRQVCLRQIVRVELSCTLDVRVDGVKYLV